MLYITTNYITELNTLLKFVNVDINIITILNKSVDCTRINLGLRFEAFTKQNKFKGFNAE